jgi:hypothetical protein
LGVALPLLPTRPGGFCFARSSPALHDRLLHRWRATVDRGFHHSPRLAPTRLADAFEDENLEEDGADEHNGGKKLQGDEDETAHDRHRLRLCERPKPSPRRSGKARCYPPV